jgi:putative ABC transport system ATP-binding protein
MAAVTPLISDRSPSPQPQPPAVEARDLVRRYGRDASAVDALRGVSLAFPAGTFTAVMGPSGSGKSTLLHLLAGLDRPTSGSILLDGQELTTMGDRQLTRVRRERIGFVFQGFNLLPTLSAEENVALPLRLARRGDRARARRLLDAVGLADRGGHRPAALSGGQEQRVAVARALVSSPAVVFADEPTGNLDSRSGGEVLALLRDAAEAHGQTIVMVTHDPRAAAAADRVVFLQDGMVVRDEPRRLAAGDVLDLMKHLEA